MIKIEERVLLSKLTTFRIGGEARFFCRIKNVNELKEAVFFAKRHFLPIIPLGEGSNVLVSDDGITALVVKIEIMGMSFTPIKWHFSEAVVGAGVSLDEFVEKSLQKGLKGLENLSGIPGTVGASPVQNVGAYGVEIEEFIKEVEVFDTRDGYLKRLSNKECRFGYRTSIFKEKRGEHFVITKVIFKLRDEREANISYRDLEQFFAEKKELPSHHEIREAVLQIRGRKLPSINDFGTAGSFFKNPTVEGVFFKKIFKSFPKIPAYHFGKGRVKLSLAWIIDNICNAKNLSFGDASVYEKQPLVIVNKGNANANDVIALANEIKSRVKDKTGIKIEPEVRFLGFKE